MKIQKKYLLIPYNTNMAPKSLVFYKDGKLVKDITIKVDCYTPEYYAYCDMSSYIGSEIELFCRVGDREFDIKDINDENNSGDCFYIEQTDIIEQCDETEKRYRPFIHFTPERGWLSDPNGLIYFNGKYHMFYQHNPYCCEWGNIHWGHAVSEDLFHWEHLPPALYPDEFGLAFSGCAVPVKSQKTGDTDKIMLFYTAAGGTTKMSEGRDFTICTAISEDNGRTFTKYADNPILVNVRNLNRDPKIVYCEETQCYIMALYLKDSLFALLSSENLFDWRMEQTFELPGDAECPDLYKLFLDNDPEKPYWIFSGSSDRYFVGQFELEESDERPRLHFVSSQPAKSLHYGKCSYAAQSFAGLKSGKVKRMSWLSGTTPNSLFDGQMSIPMQMSLKTIRNEMYLCTCPADEIYKLNRNEQKYTNIKITPEQPFLQYNEPESGRFQYGAIDCNIEAPFTKDCIVTVSLLGVKITIDMTNNSLECGGVTAPLSIERSNMKIRTIIDKKSVEIFIDEGEFFLSCITACDYHLDSMEISTTKPITLKRVEISSIQQ